jgi:predicted RNA binding protein YcfA (HicA-like mRNA interferase family)
LPKQERLTAKEAESLLLDNGFTLIRVTGSHHVYIKNGRRVVVPFHPGRVLHPKIVKQVLIAIRESQA